MKFKQVFISSFGKFSDFTIEFHDGINVVFAPNEWGKSTVAAFIKYIFYGTKNRKTLIDNERLRGAPQNGKQAGGFLVFEYDGQELRLERTGMGKEKVSIFDNRSGMRKELSLAGEPGEYFFGVDCGTFERSVFMYQNTLQVGAYSELETKIRNLVSSGEEDVSIEKARVNIEKGIKYYRNTRGGGILPSLFEEKLALEQEYYKELRKAENIAVRELELTELTERLATRKKQEFALLAQIEKGREALSEGKKSDYWKTKEELSEIRRKIAIQDEKRSGFVTTKEYIETVRGLSRAAREDDSRIAAQKEQISFLKNQEDMLTLPQIEMADGDERKKKVWKPAWGLWALGVICAILAITTRLWVAFWIAAGVLIFTGVLLAVLKNSTESLRYRERMEKLENTKRLAIQRYQGQREQLTGQMESATARLSRLLQEKQDHLNALKEAIEKANLPIVGDEHFIFAVSKLEEHFWVREELCRRQAFLLSKISYLGADGAGKESEAVRELSDSQLEQEERKLEEIRQQVSDLQQNIAVEKTSLEYDQNAMRDPAEILERLQSAENQLVKGEARLEALRLAEEVMEEAYAEIRSLFAPCLSNLTSSYFSALTDGRYEKLCTGENFQMYALENGLHKDFSVLSQGTKDSAFLALRLALSKLLFEKDLPPLVFDDAFAYLDDRRLEYTLSFLKKLALQRQMIIFTCHNREKELLDKDQAV